MENEGNLVTTMQLIYQSGLLMMLPGNLRILTAIDASQLDYVSLAESAAVMWRNLLAVYERSDPTLKTNALRDFHRYSYDGSSVAKHITCIENLAAKCKLVGEEVTEPNVIAKILDRLPDRFDVVTTWDIVPSKDQTRLNLKTMLLAAENRKMVVEESEQALIIAKKSKQNLDKKTKEENKKKLKIDRPCWTCDKTDHYRRNYLNASKNEQNTRGGR